MSVSKGNSKLGKVSNVSLIPIKDCANGTLCANKCYAKKFFRMYPAVTKSWETNSRLAKTDHVGYWGMIKDHLNKVKPKYFRWHVGGDILDQAYLIDMLVIAHQYPDTKFLCFTKRFDLNYKDIPKNLRIFFSMWPGINEPPIPEGVSRAWTQDGTEFRIPKKYHLCPGKCEGCMTCWNSKQDVVFHLHK